MRWTRERRGRVLARPARLRHRPYGLQGLPADAVADVDGRRGHRAERGRALGAVALHPRRARRPFVEDEPMGGHDPYSSSKGAAELAVDAWRRSFGLRVATARAGNVIGGGDWGEDRLIPDIMRAASAGTPIAIRRPDAIRPW